MWDLSVRSLGERWAMRVCMKLILLNDPYKLQLTVEVLLITLYFQSKLRIAFS